MPAANLVEQYFRDTASYWKDVYSENTVNGELYRSRREGVLRWVDELASPLGARVLEVGCGAGSTSIALAQRGLVVDAVDAVPDMVRLTAEAARAQGVTERLRAQVGDVQTLEFSERTFDLVIAIGVMEWMSSLVRPLHELLRVLKPGGHLIVNVDNAWALHCVLDPRMSPAVANLKKAVRRAAVKAGWVKPLARPSRCSRSEFDRILSHAGFTRVESRTTGFGPYTMLGGNLLSDRLGLQVHDRLQALADKSVPVIRDGGETYLVLARRPAA